jgi:peptidylprolyl isomerase
MDTAMAQAKKGDHVSINFTGKLEDGTIFETTLEGEECESDCCDTDECDDDDCGCGCDSGPMEITIGEEDFFPQVEEALIGMAPGEKKSVTIPAADAFGEYDEERVFTVERSELPDNLDPAVGDELVLTSDDDEEIGVVVVEVSETAITFDANHPLAGEDLTYEFELVAIL